MEDKLPVTQVIYLLLEYLYDHAGFVELTEAITAVRYKNKHVDNLVVQFAQDTINDGYMTAKEGSHVMITPLGRSLIEQHGRMPASERSQWLGP